MKYCPGGHNFALHNHHDITEILLKVALSTINQTYLGVMVTCSPRVSLSLVKPKTIKFVFGASLISTQH